MSEIEKTDELVEQGDENKAIELPAQKDELSGKQLPHGYRTEIRRLMQDCHFVIKKPEAVPENLRKAKEILSDLNEGGYEINRDFIEARSLATVAVIVLEEVMSENDSE